jgi:hypothetical protein
MKRRLAAQHHQYIARRRTAADRLPYVGPISRNRISAPARHCFSGKNSDTEVTAIQLGWTYQIAIKEHGKLNKGLPRDDRAKRSEPGAITLGELVTAR